MGRRKPGTDRKPRKEQIGVPRLDFKFFVRMQRNWNYYQMKCMEIGEFLIGFIFLSKSSFKAGLNALPNMCFLVMPYSKKQGRGRHH